MKEPTLKILVVLVIYNQDFTESSSYQSLLSNFNNLPQLAEAKFGICVYDNSPNKNNKIHSIVDVEQFYFHDATNPGVSTAYNYAFYQARELGYNWLLLMDQDSEFPCDALKIYVDAILLHKNIQLFCPILKTDSAVIISPSIFKFHRGFSPKTIQPGLNSLHNYSPLNSGLCISTTLFDKAGGYNNAIQLDYSDFYFIEKVKSVEIFFYVVNLIVRHNLSSFVAQSYQSAISRFNYLCQGAILSCNTVQDKIQAWIIILLRGLRLSMRYKRIGFINRVFNAILFNEFK